jgi:cytoskeletal protein CcmA (bactofilin family)
MAEKEEQEGERPETGFLGHLMPEVERSVSLIGEGFSLNGTIQMDRGMIRLDGRLEGAILGRGLLLVGEKGFLRGEVQVDTLILSGHAEGTLTIFDQTQITSTGTLMGKLRTSHLTVEEGGRFDGEGRTMGREEAPSRS